MTRSDFSLLLIISTLILFITRPDAATLCALITACLYHVILALGPLAFDTAADSLRKELSSQIAKQSADLETLKNKVDMLTLGRAR